MQKHQRHKWVDILPLFIVCILVAGSGNTFAAESALVYPGSDGKLVYKYHPNQSETNTVNTIPDYSYAGYKGGGVALPNAPVKKTLSPNSSGDDTGRINDAINQVADMPADANGIKGAVLLKAGTFRVGRNLDDDKGAIQMKSGVVLRGEGQGSNGTIIKSERDNNHKAIEADSGDISFSRSNTVRISDSYVGGGAMSFNVVSTSGYSVGNKILVTFTPNSTWDSLVGGASDWTPENFIIHFERKITAINGNKITLDCPVILPMQNKYGGGQISKYSTNGTRKHDIGVENLRIIGVYSGNDKMEWGVNFISVENCWVRGVTVHGMSKGAVRLDNDCLYSTVQDCAGDNWGGQKIASYRYTFNVSGQNNLVQRCYANDGRHDWVLSTRVPGLNVYLDCYSINGTTEGPHQRWATGTLFDCVKADSSFHINNKVSDSGHNWVGAQMIGWNCEASGFACNSPSGFMSYSIGCIGGLISGGGPRAYFESLGTHVSTRSLYLKQLADRLGSNAVNNITTAAQRSGYIWNTLATWKGNGAFPGSDEIPDDGGDPGDATTLYNETFASIGGSFKCSKATKTWTSNTFNIAGYSDLMITFDARSYEADKMEDKDYLQISYRIDGGSWNLIFNHKNDLSDRTETYTINGTGSTMQIMITAMTTDTNETYEVDNLVVTDNGN